MLILIRKKLTEGVSDIHVCRQGKGRDVSLPPGLIPNLHGDLSLCDAAVDSSTDGAPLGGVFASRLKAHTSGVPVRQSSSIF